MSFASIGLSPKSERRWLRVQAISASSLALSNFAGRVRTQPETLLLLLLPTSTFRCKSFQINMMHGEGIEPPTYWV
jgi:hypothetical protein